MRISFEEAKKFLLGIKSKDRVAIFTHNDLDGISSGILFHDFCKKKKCKEVDNFLVNDNKISDFCIKGKSIILIADLSPEKVLEDLKKIDRNIKVFYTDHHQSFFNIKLKNVLEFRTTDLGYIPSSRTVYELVGGKYWLALLGVLSDLGDKYEENKIFIENLLKKSGKSLDYFKNELLYPLSRASIYFEKVGQETFFERLKNIKSIDELHIFNPYSAIVKKEFEKFVFLYKIKSEKKGKIVFFYFEPEYNIKSILINYFSFKNKNQLYFFLTPEGDFISISARNQTGEFNVRSILKDCIVNLKDSFAGGHLKAAGALIKKEDLKSFKKRLFSINLKKYRLENEK